ncbi:MAG: ABC transporter ATP-binding protein/permease [Clostridia bacterium]|nr:ABC transporter ATP-binding protein/permease [Clostridia bacterium]
MLELKNISKDYLAGENTVHALKNVNLTFGKSDFVSILGPSGCGKTTMLNIIGGLDHYSSGDLIINNRSTKDYKDRDWDSYRNHSVGFVFQSYNLIPHQTVLQNVELALSLSGVSKSERKRRAKEALIQVGLGNQFSKKPGEMSGGQMQRVAIARAIVNNPDIILADEPTGALDTETSLQVMDILKEISKEKLIIMVTHNPELAEKYSTRIIKMLDGEITDDSKPLTNDEPNKDFIETQNQSQKTKTSKKEKKPSMSFATSFGLSLKNLFTKKGRTILTAFAGSIGIIGIALIFAVSQGMTTYIDTLQEDTLSSYPLTLEAQHIDMGSLLTTFMGNATSGNPHNNDAVYQKAMFYDLVNTLNSMETNENDLKAFKSHLEERLKSTEPNASLNEAVNGVQYTYNTDLLVYTKNIDGTIIRSDSQELLQELLVEYFGMDLSSMMNFSENIMGQQTSGFRNGAVLWQEMLSGKDGKLINTLLEKQYDVIYGSWPTKYNEIVLIVDENNEIDDMTLYALGLVSKEDIDALANAAFNKSSIDVSTKKWSYKEICDMQFRTIFNSDCYTYDEKNGIYTDLRDTTAGLKYLYDNGVDLKVSGIIRPNKDAVSAMLTGKIGYTNKLTEYIINNSKNSKAVSAQLSDTSKDIFTGLPFKENTGNLSDNEKTEEFKSYINKLNTKEKADTYIKVMSIPDKETLEKTVNDTLKATSKKDIETTLKTVLIAQMGMSEKEVENYISALPDDDITEMFEALIVEKVKSEYAAAIQAQLSSLTDAQLIFAFDNAMKSFTTEQFATYYDEVLEFSKSTYEDNLKELGYVDLDDPATINLYASSFENKDIIEDEIKKYNDNVDDLEEITYTDYVGIMMSSITTIINAITYVLVAFVAVSLIVSSIMIGVITLISVQERTKEIGILRAIGASKRNVSSMFNAETVIIGFSAGALGVLVTYLLCIPINIILQHLTGIANLKAILPIPVAVILVCISVVLTLFSGIIPSRSAAKKDPVVALRTE